jgi:S1-C subfamily serine protease
MFRRPSSAMLAVAGAFLAAVVLAAGGGALAFSALSSEDAAPATEQVTVTSAEPVQESTSMTVSDVYEQTSAGVVEVSVRGVAETPFGQGPQQQQGLGSGWVYDDEGHIVTNQHVVEGADSVSVTFGNGETYEAEVVGGDASTDLAVLKVDAPADVLEPLSVGNSDELQVGEGVVAIGSPFGLEGSVTSGIVSALHRQMTAPNSFTINDAIQTDAAINHGNSGGPLLNMQGEVVGVNAQIESDSGGNDGVGFAIPSSTVTSVVEQILDGKTVEHAYLGVAVQEIPESAADELGVPAGAAVTEVRDGTPAEDAGLRAATGTRTVEGQEYPTGGDVITAVDGEPVETAEDLQRAIDAKAPGDRVELTVSRGGEIRTVEVELGTRPA